MSLSAADVWSRILDRARQEVSEQTFRTWLEPTEALEFDGKTIYVGAPDQFAADWNDSKHAELLASLAPVALGQPARDVVAGRAVLGHPVVAEIEDRRKVRRRSRGRRGRHSGASRVVVRLSPPAAAVTRGRGTLPDRHSSRPWRRWRC